MRESPSRFLLLSISDPARSRPAGGGHRRTTRGVSCPRDARGHVGVGSACAWGTIRGGGQRVTLQLSLIPAPTCLCYRSCGGGEKERHAGLVVNLYSSSSTPAPEWWVPKNGNGNESIEGALPVRNGSIATLSDPPPGRQAGRHKRGKGHRAVGTAAFAFIRDHPSIHPSIKHELFRRCTAAPPISRTVRC